MPVGAEEQHRGSEARDVLGVAVPHHDKHHERVDAEHHPMRGQPGEGARDGGHGQHRAGAVQPSGRDRVGHRPVDGPRALVRPEHMRRKPQRQQQRDRHREHDDENDCGSAGVTGTEQPPGHQHEGGAEERRRPAGRRRHRVHRHHLVARHHVRQRGRKAGRDEAGETVDDQRAEQDRIVVRARREQRGDAEHQHQPPDVRADQHQPPVPTVQQRTCERSEQRVRQVQHSERGGDFPRAGGAVGTEQKAARQTGLEEPVTELAHRPQFEQSPEFGQAAHRPPKGYRCVCVNHGNSQYKYPGGPRLFATLNRSLVT